MAVKKNSKTLYEEYLEHCLAVATRTLAEQTGRPFGWWQGVILGQGSNAYKATRHQKQEPVITRILEGVRALLGQDAFVLSLRDEDE